MEEHYSPEGIWGWVIVIGAFCTVSVVDGISMSYGVMTETLTASDGTQTFSPTNSSTMMTLTQYNTVGSVQLGATLLMGPVASAIADKFGFRKTSMLGSLIASFGILSSWFLSPDEPQFWAFLLGFGILTGIGFGMMFTVSVVLVGLYFSKNRPLASGISSAGTGVGTLAMAPVMAEIMKRFHWKWAVIFQAMLCAVSFFVGAVYREVPTRGWIVITVTIKLFNILKL